jgi:hypothetical protein
VWTIEDADEGKMASRLLLLWIKVFSKTLLPSTVCENQGYLWFVCPSSVGLCRVC